MPSATTNWRGDFQQFHSQMNINIIFNPFMLLSAFSQLIS